MNAPARGTAGEDSRGRGVSPGVPRGLDLLGIALAVGSFAGALLLVVSDFTTLFNVQTEAGVAVKGGSVKGHDNHSWAMTLIGIGALPMAYGATRAGSRPAMAGLAALGLIAAVIALGFDLPDATGTNTLARTFEDATGHPQLGFYLETLGAALLVVTGGGGLVLTLPGRARPPRLRRMPAEPSERDAEARARAAQERAARRQRT